MSSPTAWPPTSPACLAEYGDADAAQASARRDRYRVPGVRTRGTGWFATAFALPQQHDYGAPDDGTGPDRTPLGQLRAALDELVDAGVLQPQRRDGIEYPIWSTVHGLAVLTGQGPLRDVPDATRHRLDELTFTFIGEALA